MIAYGGVNPYDSQRFGFGYIDTIQRQRFAADFQNRVSASNDRDPSIQAFKQVMRIREAVQAIKPMMLESQQVEFASSARANSASSVDLSSGTPGTPTTLESTEEVNTSTTAYSTDPPEWSGSTAQVTIGGDYNGRNGTDTLTFKVTDPGTHGGDKVIIKAYDSNNNQVEKIVINAGDPIDKVYTLKNGLTLTLGEGDVLKMDTFTIDVDDSGSGSYSTSQPEWSGSEGVATIGGEYDGRNGTGTLTFKVVREGVAGEDDLRIKVFNPSGILTDTINILASDPIDKQYTLKNGLTLSLSQDLVLDNDTFTLEVYDNVDNAVDPDKAFNGTGGSDPNLQPGLDVTSGSFEINGTTIDVAADDTINSVLDKINQSAAGVTATYDAATEKILLTQNTPGATPDIVLANDTSGFLSAIKLEGAVAVPGEDGAVIEDPETPLAEVESFSAVQSGSISVNGVSIDIDVNTDSLNDILDRITASEAGVTASYDSSSQRVSLVSNDSESQLTLDSGTTNFFTAVNISDGTYEATSGSVETQGVNVSDVTNLVVESIVEENSEKPWQQNLEAPPAGELDTKKLSTLVSNMAKAMNKLFDDSAFKGSPGTFLDSVRDDIRTAVSSWFDSKGSEFETEFGIRFDFEKTDKGVFNFSQAEQSRFEAALSDPQGSIAVRNALFGQESKGLFNQLHASLTAAAAEFESHVDPTGMFLNVSI